MRFFFLLLFLISTKTIHGQYADNKLCVKVCPLALLDPWNGLTVKSGVEFKTNGNNAIYCELGTYFRRAGLANTGILASTEFKHYFDEDDFSSGLYFSFELFYKNQTYQTFDSIEIQPKYQKHYSVHKDVGCCTFKFGNMYVYDNGLTAEIFVGLGIRVKRTTSTLTADENERIQSVADYDPNILANKSGNFIYPNFVTGVKFGFSLK